MPSFGGEVKPSVPCHRFAACKRSRHLPWKSHAVGKIGSAISCPYFLPSLIEVSHVAGRGAPLEMTGETKSSAQRARSYGLGASGLQGPGSAPTLLLLLLLLLPPLPTKRPASYRKVKCAAVVAPDIVVCSSDTARLRSMCSRRLFGCTTFAFSNYFSQRSLKSEIRVKCPSFLSGFNEIWSVLTHFNGFETCSHR
jgi:hypothetical protein